jgi:nucleoside-diphosphate kinase
MIERTLVLLKPDTVQRALIGKIIQRFENIGLKLIGMKLVWVDEEFSKKHYSAHVDKKFYPGLEKMITEGPVVAIVLEGIHVVELVRKIVGSTEPRTAQPGTIRADFAQHSYDYTDSKGIAIKNLVHASGNIEEAKQEVELWFKPEELHTYKTVHDIHVL